MSICSTKEIYGKRPNCVPVFYLKSTNHSADQRQWGVGLWLMMASALWITTCCIKIVINTHVEVNGIWWHVQGCFWNLSWMLDDFFIRIRTKVGFTIAGAIVVIQYFISFIKGEEVTAKREKVRCNSDHYFLFFLFKRPPSFNGVSLQR